jgi:hypothetical protein
MGRKQTVHKFSLTVINLKESIMTKGIRAFTNETFAATLPELAELGPVEFRREVMVKTMMAFDINKASAATHYNHALKMAKASSPEAVATLGRAEDKKGGRKPVHTVDVIKVKTGELVAGNVSKAEAEFLITKAEKAHKAKLAIKVAAPEVAAPAEAVAA